jgi:hypothetical protein
MTKQSGCWKKTMRSEQKGAPRTRHYPSLAAKKCDHRHIFWGAYHIESRFEEIFIQATTRCRKDAMFPFGMNIQEFQERKSCAEEAIGGPPYW